MRYKLLGRSGLRVSEVALGAMNFGTDWGEVGTTEDAARQIIDEFASAGGNFVDTSDFYTNGASERIVGAAIRAERERWVLASKYSGGIGVLHAGDVKPDINMAGNHRKNMRRAVEASLRRIGTDYIDVYYVHFWDFSAEPHEVMRSLDDLVREGKILHPAMSDTPAWVTAQANAIADHLGWAPIVATQFEYSLVERTAERELLPMARSLGLASLPWSPLGGGLLSGKYAPGATGTGRLTGRTFSPREQAIVTTVLEVADEVDRTPAQVALAWVLHQQHWGQCVPVLGVRTLDHLRDNLGALDTALDAGQLDRLDEVSACDLGVPGELIMRGHVRELTAGGRFADLDNHRRPPDTGRTGSAVQRMFSAAGETQHT